MIIGGGVPSLYVGVNKPVDPRNLSDLEKKHIPVITAPQRVKSGEYLDVQVEVGSMVAHPNEYGHFILSIDLYAGEAFLARTDLTPVQTAAKVGFTVKIQHSARELRAYCTCNLHGRWVGQRDIVVD